MFFSLIRFVAQMVRTHVQQIFLFVSLFVEMAYFFLEVFFRVKHYTHSTWPIGPHDNTKHTNGRRWNACGNELTALTGSEMCNSPWISPTRKSMIINPRPINIKLHIQSNGGEASRCWMPWGIPTAIFALGLDFRSSGRSMKRSCNNTVRKDRSHSIAYKRHVSESP